MPWAFCKSEPGMARTGIDITSSRTCRESSTTTASRFWAVSEAKAKKTEPSAATAAGKKLLMGRILPIAANLGNVSSEEQIDDNLNSEFALLAETVSAVAANPFLRPIIPIFPQLPLTKPPINEYNESWSFWDDHASTTGWPIECFAAIAQLFWLLLAMFVFSFTGFSYIGDSGNIARCRKLKSMLQSLPGAA